MLLAVICQKPIEGTGVVASWAPCGPVTVWQIHHLLVFVKTRMMSEYVLRQDLDSSSYHSVVNHKIKLRIKHISG